MRSEDHYSAAFGKEGTKLLFTSTYVNPLHLQLKSLFDCTRKSAWRPGCLGERDFDC